MSWKFAGSVNSAHSSDIKAVSVGADGRFATASRDGAVKLWRINFAADGELFELVASITEHEGFVNSVALLPGTPEYPEGVILSGGQDKLINVWDCRERKICGTLIGHEGNVCKLVSFEEASFPFVVGSCSWDGSVRCWTGEFSEVNSLRLDAGPLSGSCWSVCGCGPDSFVTAHADRSIRVWRGDREVQVISGAHDDVVRDVVRISDGDGLFVSVGNDGAVALWNSLFECIDRVPCAHPAFIYGCCYSSMSGLVATFGEEGLVKLWRVSLSGGLVLDSEFQVPMTSVWSVAFVSGSRLLVTGSTGAMFLFSSAASDWQDATVFTAELDAFTAGAAASKASEIEKNVLAASVLRCPGERVGKTVLVRSDAGAIEAHQWTGSEWTNHGQVIDPSSVKAPDFTFSVQLDDTNRSYSLPYNLDENPYSVAKNFLDRNDLPQTHLDEVAAFIIKNSGATAAVEQVKADEANENEKLSFFVVEAYNGPGVSKKLREFGMDSVTPAAILDALQTWPVEKLFPCLDWLRHELLKQQQRSHALPLLAAVPFDSLLPSSDSIASTTTTLRVLCNATATDSIRDCDLLVRAVGRCTASLRDESVAWVPLLLGLIGNCSLLGVFDAGRAVALLVALLGRINKAGIDCSLLDLPRIVSLLKHFFSTSRPLPMSAALKNEISLLKLPTSDDLRLKAKLLSLVNESE